MAQKKNSRSVYDLLFKDVHGNVVTWQLPNIPIMGWAAFILLSYLFNDPSIKSHLEVVSKCFLFTWAYLELFQGVNYFRRILGLIVILYIIF